ncbi:hypothetical protein IAI10_21320 [Clostridium sp. 19966]|uniref:hypothetical protein n=1 Tax=Clostridium sp. 19966 TaxID=2768166 RepID=UPI0028E001FC|nr:hypothetical protein [Clostridium sp. 19966]MDT8719196.1 hypothetical protein [Clostridium sp. 19966]
MSKIKIFKNVSLESLESNVNDFIKDKKVISISQSESIVLTNNSSHRQYQERNFIITVLYEEQ